MRSEHLRWYFVCLCCGAKWFAPQQRMLCPQDVLNELFDSVLNSGGGTSVAEAHASQSGAHVCDILTLELPEGLTLNVLGLVVDTSGICLDVHAERGSGNLLGNLLCSVSGLLDGPANANAIQSLVGNIQRLLDHLGL